MYVGFPKSDVYRDSILLTAVRKGLLSFFAFHAYSTNVLCLASPLPNVLNSVAFSRCSVPLILYLVLFLRFSRDTLNPTHLMFQIFCLKRRSTIMDAEVDAVLRLPHTNYPHVRLCSKTGVLRRPYCALGNSACTPAELCRGQLSRQVERCLPRPPASSPQGD